MWVVEFIRETGYELLALWFNPHIAAAEARQYRALLAWRDDYVGVRVRREETKP